MYSYYLKMYEKARLIQINQQQTEILEKGEQCALETLLFKIYKVVNNLRTQFVRTLCLRNILQVIGQRNQALNQIYQNNLTRRR